MNHMGLLGDLQGPPPVWIPTAEGIADTNLAAFMRDLKVQYAPASIVNCLYAFRRSACGSGPHPLTWHVCQGNVVYDATVAPDKDVKCT